MTLSKVEGIKRPWLESPGTRLKPEIPLPFQTLSYLRIIEGMSSDHNIMHDSQFGRPIEAQQKLCMNLYEDVPFLGCVIEGYIRSMSSHLRSKLVLPG